jgi:hypothetical protein
MKMMITCPVISASPAIVLHIESVGQHLGERGPLSQGVHAGRKVLRIRRINGMDVRKKRPRGFK